MSTMNTDGEFAEIDTSEAEFDAMWDEATQSEVTVTTLWFPGATATLSSQAGHAAAVHALSPGTRFSLDRAAAVLI